MTDAQRETAGESAATVSERLRKWRTTATLACLFVLNSLLLVPIPGVNEPHYLCKAKAFFSPDWCSQDLFLSSGNAHYVFFVIAGWLTQFLSLPTTALLGRTISYALLAVSWMSLARTLRLDRHQTIASAAMFCLSMMLGSFSGEWIIGGFESKVPSYGFSFLAVSWWLRSSEKAGCRPYVIAGICSGLSVMLHPVVGLWFCIGICLAETSRRLVPRQCHRTLRQWPVDLAVYAATAAMTSLPGLIPALSILRTPGISATDAEKANFIQVFWRLQHHLDPSAFPGRAWTYAGIHLLLTLFAGLALFRQKRSDTSLTPISENTRKNPEAATVGLVLLLAAGLLIASVGVFIGWHNVPAQTLPDWPWRASLLKFYPFRFLDSLLPTVASLLLTMAFLKPTTKPSLGARWSRRFTPTVINVLLIAATILTAWSQRQTVPRNYLGRTYNDWKEACRWIQANSPVDSLFFTPRESVGFKWYAERAEYVCFKDCPQDTKGILEWNNRLWVIFEWANAAFADQLFDDDDLRQLHRRTGADFLITRSLGPFTTTPVYQNASWRIYSVPKDESPN